MLFTPSAAAEDLTMEVRIDKAVEWLVANQKSDGFWGEELLTAVVDTAEIAGYFKEKSIQSESLEKAQKWLESIDKNNIDYTARVLPFIQEANRKKDLISSLASSQKPDGGWGLTGDFEGDVLDTVLVLNSLIEENNPDTELIKKGLSYLISVQNENGSWSYVLDGEPSVMLTSEIVLCLNKFVSKMNLTSSSIETAMKKAGNFLVSKQLEDGTWGTGEESLADTLVAYRAVIKTVGIDPVLTVDKVIQNLQQSNGSWYNNPYLTILAIRALNEKTEMPHADITDIRMFKTTKDNRIESYTFGAYEELEIEAVSEYDSSVAKQIQFIKGPYGNILYAQVGDILNWNTMSYEPGVYTVIAQVKENGSGKIIDSYEKEFTIEPSFIIKNVVIRTDRQSTTLNKPVTINVETAFYIEANVDKRLTVTTSVYGTDGSFINLHEDVVEIEASEQVKVIGTKGFEPDITSEKEYTIRTDIFEGTAKVAEGETVFKVLPPPAPTRIDAEQSLDKEVLYPGKDSVTLSYKLFGVGTPEVPERNPIDLVLILDRSGSMSGTPWTKAKEAAKIIVDLILPQDRCAVIDFSYSATLRQGLTSDKELLKQVISSLGSGGGTSIHAGIARGIQLIDSVNDTDRQRVFMLLSDGESNESSALAQANSAAEKGITIFTLGLGGVNERLLKNIANITGGEYRYSPTANELIDMMTEIAGKIFDTSGRNIVVEVTIPENGLNIRGDSIEPVPSSISTDAYGNKVITWNYDRLIMGQEKYINITFEGENLLSDTVVQLAKSAKITYYDANDTLMEISLPQVEIEENKFKLDTKIETDKVQYHSGEDVEILVDSKNLTSYLCTLTGKVEIVDDNNNVIELISLNEGMTWQPEETLNHNYTWNTKDYIAGTYNVRVTFIEQDKLISSQIKSFEIIPDKNITNRVVTDKIKYYPGEKVSVINSVYNPSSNAIARNLTIRTLITNSRGEVVWGNENTIDEIIYGDTQSRKSMWDIEQNEPGRYTVTSVVYGKNELCKDFTVIEILGTQTTGYGIIGSLNVLTKEIYPTDDLVIQIELTNSGNVDIAGVKRNIIIINPSTGEVVDTIEDIINLDVDACDSKEVSWSHKALKSGQYLVVYNAELPNETIINLGSGYFTVLQKGSESKPSSGGGKGSDKNKDYGNNDDIIEEPKEEIPVALPVDLAVSIKADKSTYTKGQIVTYTIKFRNMLDAPVGEFEVTAQIPNYTSIADSAGGEVKDGVIVWKIPGLPAKGEGQKIYKVLVNDFEEPEVIVSNTARILSKDQRINTQDDTSTIKIMLRSDENGEVLHRAYIYGYPDGTFRPEKQVTRAEVAAMLAKLLDLKIKEEVQTAYSDVPKNHWAAGVIQAVTESGLFKGYEDNTFRPDESITRAELAVVIAKYLKLEEVRPFEIHYSDIEGHWAVNLIEEVTRYNIIEGYEDGTYRPDEKIKRSETVTLINKMLYRGPLKADMSSFADVGVNHWAFGHIEEAAREHVLELDEYGDEVYHTQLRGVDDVE